MLASKLIASTAAPEECLVYILPKDSLPIDVRKYVAKYAAVIAGSFATHWAQIVLKAGEPVKWNDIDVFIHATKSGMVDELPGEITSTRHTGDYQFGITDNCDDTYYNKIIYNTVVSDPEKSHDVQVQYIFYEHDSLRIHWTLHPTISEAVSANPWILPRPHQPSLLRRTRL
jgi:hypothetical protein